MLNVTINQSCQEIPSQIFEDSGISGKNNEVNSEKPLWSDEAQVLEYQEGTKATSTGQQNSSDNEERMLDNLNHIIADQHRLLDPRVDGNQNFFKRQPISPVVLDKEALLQDLNEGGKYATRLQMLNVNATVSTR